GDEGLRRIRVFREVEGENRHRELQLGRLADRPHWPERVVDIFGEILLGRIVLGGDVDRDTVRGQEQFARQEGLVVGGVIPGSDAWDEGLRQLLGIFQRLRRFRRVDDDLILLVDGEAAMAPEDVVYPGVGVAGGVPERKAGRRVVLLQRLAELEI